MKGKADLENNVSATPETLFRTGSIAKPMTAVAAMRLVEDGKLDLDAPIQKYCPAFPQEPWTITAQEVLGHISGVRHYKEGEMDNTHHYLKLSDGFAIFANDPLLFEPETNYQYSTYGFSVIGCALEGAAGRSYLEIMQQLVFAPAHMTHTFPDDVFEIVPHRARGYSKRTAQVINAGLMDSSYKIPGGGYVSTPRRSCHSCGRTACGRAGETRQPQTHVDVTETSRWQKYGLRDGLGRGTV